MAQDRAAWHAARRRGIGGSDVAAVFGLDPYKSTHQLWLEKTGRVQPEEVVNGHVERGNRLEPIIAEIYAELTGRKTRRHPAVVHPSYPWMIGNVDRVAWDVTGGRRPSRRVVEVKAPSLAVFRRIMRSGLPFTWQLQGQHYLAIVGWDGVDYAVHCADTWETVVLPMEPDLVIREALIDRERDFWNLVLADEYRELDPIPTELEGSGEDVTATDAVVRTDPAFGEAAANYREAKDLLATAEELVDQAKARIVELVGDSLGRFDAPGLGRFAYTEPKAGSTFDHKSLAAVRPLDPIRFMSYMVNEVGARPDEAAEDAAKLTLDLAPFYTPKKSSRRLTFYRARS